MGRYLLCDVTPHPSQLPRLCKAPLCLVIIMRAIFAITLAVAAASVSTIDGAALSGFVFSCDAHPACIGDGICVATWVVAICAHCMCLAPLNITPQRWPCFSHHHPSRSRSCCAAPAAASVPFLLVLQPRTCHACSVCGTSATHAMHAISSFLTHHTLCTPSRLNHHPRWTLIAQGGQRIRSPWEHVVPHSRAGKLQLCSDFECAVHGL